MTLFWIGLVIGIASANITWILVSRRYWHIPKYDSELFLKDAIRRIK